MMKTITSDQKKHIMQKKRVETIKEEKERMKKMGKEKVKKN